MAKETMPTPGGDKEWAYLGSRAFQSRYALAAWQLEDVAHIVEIGGYRTPITGFVRTPKKSVTVIDPHITPLSAETLLGQPCKVRHVPAFFQDWKEYPTSYGLVLLGLDFELYEVSRKLRAEILDQFVPVVRAASRIVMEAATDWTASRWLAGWVEKTTGYRPSLDLVIEMQGDLGVDLSKSWPPLRKRHLIVLDR
jgi:hypothetical protein